MTLDVVVVGDVGAGTALHVGDEAMLEAALLEVGGRVDVRWTVVSGVPEESAQRYGTAAVGRLGFGALDSRARREARLEQLVEAAGGGRPLPADDPAVAVLDAVSGADAVLVAGGGNLATAWPEHVYERAALAAIARARATPVVVSGQGLGPALDRRDGELVAGLLTSAALVGVRDVRSATLAERLGVPVDRVRSAVDDAAFLPDAGGRAVLGAGGASHGDYVAATFSPVPGSQEPAALEQLATLLTHVADTTGLEVLLVPHQGAVRGPATGDRAVHDALVAAAKCDRVRALDLLPARETAAVTRGAAFVLSSRYHPVVFGLSAGVPTVGVSVDDYTESKIRGALAHSGLEGWCVSLLGLGNGVLAAAVEQAWQDRDALADQAGRAVPEQRERKQAYWDAVAAALSGRPAGAPVVIDLASRPGQVDEVAPQDPWAARNADALQWDRTFSEHHLTWQQEARERTAELVATLEQLRLADRARSVAVDEAAGLREELAVERAAGDAARQVAADLLDELHALRPTGARVEALQDRHDHLAQQLTALHATKLLRWSGPARKVYGWAGRQRSEESP